MSRQAYVDPTPPACIARLTSELTEIAKAHAARGQRFALTVSGGSTPVPLWRSLAELRHSDFPWASVELYWADERMVPPDAGDSNFGTVARELLEHVPIPPDQVHRIHGEYASAEAAAEAYEAELERRFGVDTRGPTFSVVLLGVGPDGHTASLFPGDAALSEPVRRAVPVEKAGQPPFVPRVTLTLRSIEAARRVIFLVTGAEKRRILEQIWKEPEGARASLPAARVIAREEVTWFLDAAAAPQSLLPPDKTTRGHA
jgi:6-phosphogluconolactonase